MLTWWHGCRFMLKLYWFRLTSQTQKNETKYLSRKTYKQNVSHVMFHVRSDKLNFGSCEYCKNYVQFEGGGGLEEMPN